MLGREMVAAAATPEDALVALVPRMLDRWAAGEHGPAELLTLYLGARDNVADAPAGDTVAAWLDTQIPALAAAGIEVEVVIGGQPHYPFLASLE